MVVNDLSDVFVASGVNKVNDKTFTALFHGYNLRGKILETSIPTVKFIFYGNVQPDTEKAFEQFKAELSESYGNLLVEMTRNSVSIVLDLDTLDKGQLKERLGKISRFMMLNDMGVINIPPEPVEPPKQAPVSGTAKKHNKTQQVATKVPVAPPKPVYEEPKIPFEKYAVLERLTQMFLLGINQISNNSFTTLYHGYNVMGKMLSPTDPVVELVFYGELMGDVAEEFEKLKTHLTEKYGNFPVRMVGGSCDAIFDFKGKDIGQSKEMLGEISGFMMRHSIVAVNLPATIPPTIKSITAESLKNPQGQASSSSAHTSSASGSAPEQNRNGRTQQSQQDNFVGKFLKKFGKKP